MINDIEKLLDHTDINIKKTMDIAVVGLSGGADSTLVATLCVRALGADNVYGVHMPHGKDDKQTFEQSIAISDALGIQSDVINIKPTVDVLSQSFGCEPSQLNAGNMRSRMRMIVLYTICCNIAESNSSKRVRVVGTGNLSEDFIGYDTKGGDALADYFPIGSLVKSEVYQLLDYFRDQGVLEESMINRVPSAGLWEGQTDEDELGYSYGEMEPYVISMSKSSPETKDIISNEVARFVWYRHCYNKHKHEAPPVLDLRGFCNDI